MKLKEVGFSESIQLQDGHWIKAWASVEGEVGDDRAEMWAFVKEQVKKQIILETGGIPKNSLLSSEVPPHLQPIIQTDKTNIEAEADTCTQIYSCTDLKVLESYKFIVRGKPQLQQAYDEMYLKLSK